jgi:purine-binding chemotaxis protein CheW
MMHPSAARRAAAAAPARAAALERELLTFSVGRQLFGVPVLSVRDVLDYRPLARIPLAPPEVAGALNLRGRIITAVDVRRRLGLPPREAGAKHMSVVVEHDADLYNLIVDSVGEVLRLSDSAFEPNPGTLDPRWRDYSEGIYQLQGALLVVLNVSRLLSFGALAK